VKKTSGGYREVMYVGQGKMINGEWTPHGVGIEITRINKLGIDIAICNYTLGTFE